MNKSDFLKFSKENNLSKNKENILLQKITGLSKERLFILWTDFEIDSEKFNKYKEKIAKWIPFEYVINSSEFYGIDFYVDERVLIPRDDTEVIVENVLKLDFDLLIDVWTWSWTIPISILDNVDKNKKIIALDISKDALEVSKINMSKQGFSYKIQESDLLSYIIDNVDILSWNNKIIITANLPYIKNNDFENMDKEVYNFEPSIALYWWNETWFELYEKLISQILYLKLIKNEIEFTLFIEIWFDQKDYSEFFLKELWLKFEYFKDTSKIERVIKIKF